MYKNRYAFADIVEFRGISLKIGILSLCPFIFFCFNARPLSVEIELYIVFVFFFFSIPEGQSLKNRILFSYMQISPTPLVDIYRYLSMCCARIIFQRTWRAHSMADRVTLSIPASPDQIFPHPETCIFTLFTLNCMFTLSGARSLCIKLCARNTWKVCLLIDQCQGVRWVEWPCVFLDNWCRLSTSDAHAPFF